MCHKYYDSMIKDVSTESFGSDVLVDAIHGNAFNSQEHLCTYSVFLDSLTDQD